MTLTLILSGKDTESKFHQLTIGKQLVIIFHLNVKISPFLNWSKWYHHQVVHEWIKCFHWNFIFLFYFYVVFAEFAGHKISEIEIVNIEDTKSYKWMHQWFIIKKEFLLKCQHLLYKRTKGLSIINIFIWII